MESKTDGWKIWAGMGLSALLAFLAARWGIQPQPIVQPPALQPIVVEKPQLYLVQDTHITPLKQPEKNDR